MEGNASATSTGTMYVRALYDYEADDKTSLSFHEGDVIQVITQLESGWWDGVIDGVRGWFPSNYCQVISGSGNSSEQSRNDHSDLAVVSKQESETPEESLDQVSLPDATGVNSLLLEGGDSGDKSRADFWIPQATPDGRLFYYNMMTGDRSMELPLESPISSAETGPGDRLNAALPDNSHSSVKRRFSVQDEDNESATSVSEAGGESSTFPSGDYGVCRFFFLTHPSVGELSTDRAGLVARSNILQRCLVCFNINGLDRQLLTRKKRKYDL